MVEEPQPRRKSGREILDTDDQVWEDVDVPEWGTVVRIARLTGVERDLFDESVIRFKREQQGKKTVVTRTMVYANARAKLVARSAIDEYDNRLFTDTQIEELGQKSAAALNRLFMVAQRLSGLSDEQMEELVDDLGEGPSAAGGSG